MTSLPTPLYQGDSKYCPGSPQTSNVTVTAADADGVSRVQLFFRQPGATAFSQKLMSQASGGKWQASISSAADKVTSAGSLRFYVIATDSNAAPKTTRFPATGTQALTVRACVNTGPTITLATIGVSELSLDPTGAGICPAPQRTTITGRATDVDEVKSLTLHFTGPGLPSDVARRMSPAAPDWTAQVSPASDGMTDAGTMTWWIEATDYTGLSTLSSKHSVRIVACGTPPPQTPPDSGFGNISTPTYGALAAHASSTRLVAAALGVVSFGIWLGPIRRRRVPRFVRGWRQWFGR